MVISDLNRLSATEPFPRHTPTCPVGQTPRTVSTTSRRKRARFCTLPPYRFVRRLASSSPPRGDAERNMATQASEAEQQGGKKWVCVLREPKLRNPNYSMFAKATILTIHFDQTLGA